MTSEKQLYATFRPTEDSQVTVRARLVGDEGALLTQSSVGGDADAITVTVFDLDSATPETAIYGPVNLSKTTVLFNSLQTAGWDSGGGGYNFKDTRTAAQLLFDGGRRYTLKYKITTTAYGSLYILVRCQARSVPGV